MKLSFVIPAYNEEAHVGECLKTVLREITDNNLGIGVDVEVVVVNNASTDRTAEIAASHPGVTVLNEPIKGLVMARRAGFVVTTGELVANLDADTRVPKGWLAHVLKEFAHTKDLVALSGPYIYYDLNDVERACVKMFYFFGWLFYLLNHYVFKKGAMLQGGNFILRRDAWERAGGFDTTISFYGEDTDVARRMTKHGVVKWTWRLPMYASGRRLAEEGLLNVGYTYAINFFTISLYGRPHTREYRDIRLMPQKQKE